MSDRYREQWERRQAKWQRRQAKWEARTARHEAYRVGYETRRAARAARIANWQSGTGAASSHRSPPQSARLTLALLGGLFILLGLSSLRFFPGVGSLVSLFLCLMPGVALLIPLLIWTRSRSHTPVVAVEQDMPQAAPVQDEAPAPVSEAMPQVIPKASPVPSQLNEQPQFQASTSDLDPSYYRERAAGYRRLQSIIRNRRPGPLADVMSSVIINLQQWEERVSELADRLTTFERDAIIQRDIKEVPANITRLRGQIEIERDEGLIEQMQRTLAGYQAQQAMLDTLVRLMRRTRLLLDDTLVAMGTIYSQVRVIDASDIDSLQTTRIAAELDEQVTRLNDLLSALGDAYRGANQPDEPADSAKRLRLERGSAASL